MALTLVTSHTALPPEGDSDRPELVEGWGGPAENYAMSTAVEYE